MATCDDKVRVNLSTPRPDPDDRRIVVEGASDNREWMWAVGIPNSNERGMSGVLGRGRARTRRGALRAARRRLRELDRQNRHRDRSLVIDIPARTADGA